MRIRKNAKVSPLLYSSHASAPEIWQTHVCRLNQSPWDVIPFAPDSNHQPEAEDNSFSENASLGDSIGAVESVASLRAAGPMKLVETVLRNDNQKKKKMKMKEVVDREVKMADDYDDENHEAIVYYNNNNSYKTKKQRNYGGELLVKGKNEAKDHDHQQLNLAAATGNYSNYRSNNNNNNNNHDNHTVRDYEDPNCNPTTSSYKKLSLVPAATATTRAATWKKAATGKNPNEFYYYSGFGPLWGKKRGNRGNTDVDQAHDDLIIENVESIDHPMAAAATGSATTNTTDRNSNSSLIDDDEDDDEEDEDDDDDDFGNGGEKKKNNNKRMRKPVKARSLKSLM